MTRTRTSGTWAALAAAAALSLAQAPALAATKAEPLDVSKSGVAVYPGAKPDDGVTDFVRTSLGMSGAAFRTPDGVGKVVDFYGKQAGVKPMAQPTKEGAGFMAGCKDEYNAVMKKNMSRCNLQVTVQNPWMDMKTGKMMSDTLITIVRQK